MNQFEKLAAKRRLVAVLAQEFHDEEPAQPDFEKEAKLKAILEALGLAGSKAGSNITKAWKSTKGAVKKEYGLLTKAPQKELASKHLAKDRKISGLGPGVEGPTLKPGKGVLGGRKSALKGLDKKTREAQLRALLYGGTGVATGAVLT